MNGFTLPKMPSGAQLIEALKAVPDIVREPTANPVAAWTLLGIFTVLLLIALVLVLFLIVGSNEEEPAEDDPQQHEARPQVEPSEDERAPRRPLSLLLHGGAWLLLLLAVLWVSTGVTTGSRAVCESCHQDSPHVEAATTDPHGNVSCVSCHEPGNAIERATVNVPARLQHFVEGRTAAPAAPAATPATPAARKGSAYGRAISSTSCESCHRDELRKVIENPTQGVKVSHREPLAAGAECVDCHQLRSGVVSNRTVGMAPCLRCHDGEAASEGCSTCHTGDPAKAIRVERRAEDALAGAQVPAPRCDGCHRQAEEGCDSCHGVRMPHTQEFMQYAHAREGAIDLWTNGGRTCGKCHYAGKRECTRCHSRFYAHGTNWMRIHGTGVSYRSGCGCHDQKAYAQGRQFCAICHSSRPKGAKP